MYFFLFFIQSNFCTLALNFSVPPYAHSRNGAIAGPAPTLLAPYKETVIILSSDEEDNNTGY
jgi:hypothetical protein